MRLLFYLQVRNTLCYLVLGLQDEAVVNFGEAVAGGNRQNLWEKHRCQTTNHRQACVSGNSSAYSTHTPPRTPSWRPCCLLATGGRRPGRSSDWCPLEISESTAPESPESLASDLRHDRNTDEWTQLSVQKYLMPSHTTDSRPHKCCQNCGLAWLVSMRC